MKTVKRFRKRVLRAFQDSEIYIQVICLLGIGLVITPTTAWAGYLRRTQSNCYPIGRIILSNDPGILNGTQACAEDELIVAQGSKVDILCQANGQLFRLKEGQHSISGLCQSSKRTMRRCSSTSSLLCGTLRGEKGTSPQLYSIYGDTFLQSPSSIRWHAVVGAQTYKVFIEGAGQIWRFEEETTSLNLVNHQVQFNLDTTYLITVEAYRNQQSIGESSMALNMLSLTQQTKINQYVDAINQFQISQIERIKLLDAVYMSEKLLSQTILMLETHLATTESAELRLLLGDRYWDAGYPELTKISYLKAIALGEQLNQDIWVQQAQNGLSIISEITANDPGE